MRESDRSTRRSVLKLTGAVGATALVAGCTDGNGNGEDPAEEENGEDPAEENGEDPAEEENGEDPTEEENGEEEDREDSAEDENGEDPAEEENGNGNGETLEPDTRIEFDAQTPGWIGMEPEEIADEENPTLTLQDGESYEIGWEVGDGATHNIELVDENDEVIEDYETEEATEGGDEQFLEFDATDEIAEYVCRVHPETMRGTIEIETNGAAEENGGAEEDDES
jgi:hypothetical protein